MTVPVLLAVLLLLTATFAASILHNHHGSSETTCQICHLSHQPVEQHLDVDRVAVPMPVGSAPVPVDSVYFASPALCIRISRAPPLA
jgi:hypothetical protein